MERLLQTLANYSDRIEERVRFLEAQAERTRRQEHRRQGERARQDREELLVVGQEVLRGRGMAEDPYEFLDGRPLPIPPLREPRGRRSPNVRRESSSRSRNSHSENSRSSHSRSSNSR